MRRRASTRFSCTRLPLAASRTYTAPGYSLGPLWTAACRRSRLSSRTTSGKLSVLATRTGMPSSSTEMLGSGVMTERALWSTRLPLRLPRMRPSLPFSRLVTDRSARLVALTLAIATPPVVLLLMYVMQFCCSTIVSAVSVSAFAPAARRCFSRLLAFTICASWMVRSSSRRRPELFLAGGRTAMGGTGSTDSSSASGFARPANLASASGTRRNSASTCPASIVTRCAGVSPSIFQPSSNAADLSQCTVSARRARQAGHALTPDLAHAATTVWKRLMFDTRRLASSFTSSGSLFGSRSAPQRVQMQLRNFLT